MRLLHTSDWHLGAKLGRHDRAPDHLEALKGLLEVAESARPDLILHTGDLFDASRPPYEALQLGVRALGRLAKVAPTVVIAGNHDSSLLFRVIDDLAGASIPRRLWLVTAPQVLSFPEIADAPVSVACVPFIPPGAIAHYATDDPARFEGNYADGVKTLNQRLLDEAHDEAGARGIVLYAAHLHVQGARPGKSERRITVGEDYATHVEGLQRALYCAFGHIHDPQLLPGGAAQGRYAGSLVPLDFGERQQAKQAVLVTIGNGVQVDTRDLPAGRRLVEFGKPGSPDTLRDLEGLAVNGGLDSCILKARVASDDPIPDLAERVMKWSPKCAVFEVVNVVKNQPIKPIEPNGGGAGAPSPEQLFREWRMTAPAPKAPHEVVSALFARALGGVNQAVAPDFGVTTIESRADRVLASLASRRNGAQG